MHCAGTPSPARPRNRVRRVARYCLRDRVNSRCSHVASRNLQAFGLQGGQLGLRFGSKRCPLCLPVEVGGTRNVVA